MMTTDMTLGAQLSTSSLQAGRAPVTMRVPFEASSVSVARQRLRLWLFDVGATPDTVDDARVVISELIANSVRHAQPLPEGDILVNWALESRGLDISVTDGGSGTRPRTVHAPASAVAGRGMAIVESLAITWWAEREHARSTVHAVVAV
jgi:anti-sigma regulatory factor (Ser/Thr protein kinase)